ncbi:MAG: hypothetical protein VB050_04235 [Geobacteraceae bacterium]|nr:hypothetical protein [Geobacteraceae bacterium]
MPDEVQRVFAIRSILILLKEMNLASEVCRIYEVSAEDLDMLAFIESELQKMEPEPE